MTEKKKDVPFNSRTEKSKDTWETPDYFYKLLDDEFHFTLDPASSQENHKCKKYYIIEEDGLSKSWEGETVFVNPPFTKADLFLEKSYEEGIKKNTTVVIIIPSRSETRYWHNFCMKSNEIRFCKGRVNFKPSKEILEDLRLENIKREKESRKEKKLGGSNFPLDIIIFKEKTSEFPKISTFYHKKSDLEK